MVFSYLTLANTSINLAQNTTVNSLSIEESAPVSISGSNLTVNAGGIDMLSALYSAGIYSPLILGAAQSWNVASGLALVVAAPLSGTGNLIVNGPGTVALNGTNTSASSITVSDGALQANGLLLNSITVADGTLSGTGTIGGPVQIKRPEARWPRETALAR